MYRAGADWGMARQLQREGKESAEWPWASSRSAVTRGKWVLLSLPWDAAASYRVLGAPASDLSEWHMAQGDS